MPRNNSAVTDCRGTAIWRAGVTFAAAMVAGVTVPALPASAQSAQGEFALPSPTPSPSGPPQGPVDERMGVQIGPRVIVPAPPPPQAQSQTQAAPQAETQAETQAPSQAAPQAEPQAQAAVEAAPAAPTATPTPTPRTAQPAQQPPALPDRANAIAQPAQQDAPAPAPDNAAPVNAGARGTQVPLPGTAAPGFETLPYDSGAFDPQAFDAESGTPIGPEGWYDVDQSGNRTAGGPPENAVTNSSAIAASMSAERIQRWNTTRNAIAIGLALVLLLASVLVALRLRRKRVRTALGDNTDQMLAVGLRNSMASMMAPTINPAANGRPEMASDFVDDNDKDDDVGDNHLGIYQGAGAAPGDGAGAGREAKNGVGDEFAPAMPAPQPQDPAPHKGPPGAPPEDPIEMQAGDIGQDEPDPMRLDMGLEIIGAARSVMMFSIDFRLDIANRADVALRDLRVAGKLVCAQRSAGQSGGGQNNGGTGAKTLELIERIGPQQSRRISGQLQLPLSEVQAIRQGAKPLFIPLLHVTVERTAPHTQVLHTSSFVIGTPSATSSGRVHPLPLDTVPGGMPALRGQLIKQPFSTGAAA